MTVAPQELKKQALLMPLATFVAFLVCLSFLPQQASAYQAKVRKKKVLPRPPQFVCLSFDGSGDPPFWRMTLKAARDFNKKHKSKGKSLHFAYYVSGIHFFTSKYRRWYKTYRYKNKRYKMVRGRAVIRWGGRQALIDQRIQLLHQSIKEGHEIGSHVIGHFGGHKWTRFQWEKEFEQFNAIMWPILKTGKQPHPYHWYKGKNLVSTLGVLGFRAPRLETSPGLWPVMKKHGLRYDASGIQKRWLWPRKNRAGIWRFSLALLNIAGSGKRTLSMDYNFYMAQTGAKKDHNRARRRLYQRQMLATYRRYFMANYHGNRAPIHIGHHLVSLNGYGYWRAYIQFAREVCALPEVRCVTYHTLLKYMDKLPEKTRRAYQRGRFDQSNRPKKYFRRMFRH